MFLSVDTLYSTSLDAWDALGMGVVRRHSRLCGFPAGVVAHYIGRYMRMHLEAEERIADVWPEAVELTVALLAGRLDVAVSLADQGVIDPDTAARLGMLQCEEIGQLLDGDDAYEA